MTDFWNRLLWGNPLYVWLTVTATVIGASSLLYAARVFLLPRLERLSRKTTSTLDDFLVLFIHKALLPFTWFLIVYLAAAYLGSGKDAGAVLHKGLMLVSAFYVTRTLTLVLQYFVLRTLEGQPGGPGKQKQAGGLIIVAKAGVWIIGSMFVLNNLGYNVSSLIAGLGIGGIAIALAAQAVLADVFSYFVILFDRPFETGDFIVVDNDMGIVEYIGVKTTRLRTLGGEQLICANKNLTDARVHNYKRMQTRRVVFSLGVTYETPPEVLKSIPGIVKGIITGQGDLQFDRGHLSAFGNSSLNFEFVYYIPNADYTVYMDKQQAVYFGIVEAFEKRHIELAYPTQKIVVDPPIAAFAWKPAST
jgi:small-conductance mechanosensitive channel